MCNSKRKMFDTIKIDFDIYSYLTLFPLIETTAQ